MPCQALPIWRGRGTLGGQKEEKWSLSFATSVTPMAVPHPDICSWLQEKLVPFSSFSPHSQKQPHCTTQGYKHQRSRAPLPKAWVPTMYWVGQKVRMVFFHKISHIFSFSPITLLTGYFEYVGYLPLLVLWVEAGVLLNNFQCISSPTAKNCLAKMSIVPRNFTNHFWHVRSVTCQKVLIEGSISTFSIYTTNLFFSCISVVFLPFLK